MAAAKTLQGNQTKLIMATIIIMDDNKEPISDVGKQKPRIIKDVGLLVYLAIHSSSQAVGSRRLKQLPCSSLVESDDGSHVVFADRAVDERGDEDSSQSLHTVEVCKRLIGKVPETHHQGQGGTPRIFA